MAIITLKPNTDPAAVAEELRQVGITMGQKLEDGRYVAFIHQRKWMLMQYPALADLYREDRAFWKAVRKRTRNGEDVPREEIAAHADYFKQEEQRIIDSYEHETDHRTPLRLYPYGGE